MIKTTATHRPAELTLTALAPTAFVLAAVLAWDVSGWDLPLARLAGGAHGFALRENWWLGHLLHDGMRRLSWGLALLLCLGVWWPFGALRGLRLAARMQLACTTLAAAGVVSLAKALNATSCPWDLVEFGGLARHLPHWRAFTLNDGGPGHCFPAGHASAGFAFVGGWFVFRAVRPGLARAWLVAALGSGLLLGLVRQLRGAHFMSHTLWSGLLCWAVAGLLDRAWPRDAAWLDSASNGHGAVS